MLCHNQRLDKNQNDNCKRNQRISVFIFEFIASTSLNYGCLAVKVSKNFKMLFPSEQVFIRVKHNGHINDNLQT